MRRLALTLTALIVLSGSSIAATTPAFASSSYAKTHVKTIMKHDKANKANKSNLHTYRKAYSRLAAHCTRGKYIWFTVDAVGDGPGTRLKYMRAVNKAIGSRHNVDCAAALLDAQMGETIEVGKPTPSPHASLPSAGAGCGAVASWTPLLTRTGISVNTETTGRITVQVTRKSGHITTKYVTVGIDDTPYSVELPKVKPSSIRYVDLFWTEGGEKAWCVVSRAS